MKTKKEFLKVYLIIALIYGILGLIDGSFIFFNFTNNLFSLILAFLSFIFFFFNIISLIIFRHHYVPKLAYVLPIYHLITYCLFFGVGFYLFFKPDFYDLTWIPLMITGIVFSLLEIMFCIYLLKKTDFTPNFHH